MKIYIQRNLLKKIHLKIYKILMNLVKIKIMKEKRMILKWKYDTINTLKEVKLWEITNLMRMIKYPRTFIIEECIPACKELWKKNIYTFMVSDHLNEGVCWIEVIVDNLSDENKEIFTQLEGEDIIKFSYHKGCINFGVNSVGSQAQKRLLELSQKFQMQDVPHGEAYITLPEYLIMCGCYDEVENPNYVLMAEPWDLGLPMEQMVDYLNK